jgi:hypothetical protein
MMRWKDTTSRVVVCFLLVVGDVLGCLVEFLAHVANSRLVESRRPFVQITSDGRQTQIID